jgi:transcriptional regulator with XRE-family HTH domain
MKKGLYDMSLGTRLRKRREELGFSQRELARLVNTRQATISDLERGTLKNPGVDIVRRLAKILGVTADWLIGMYEDDVEAETAAVTIVD